MEYLHPLEEKLRTFDVIDDYDSDYENGCIRAKAMYSFTRIVGG